MYFPVYVVRILIVDHSIPTPDFNISLRIREYFSRSEIMPLIRNIIRINKELPICYLHLATFKAFQSVGEIVSTT